MGQATFANNTSIKISGSISQQNAIGTSGTLYSSVPSNGYAEINVIVVNAGGTTITVSVGGRPVVNTTAVMTQSILVSVGPLQQVTWSSAGTTISAGSIHISGTLFVNSP